MKNEGRQSTSMLENRRRYFRSVAKSSFSRVNLVTKELQKISKSILRENFEETLDKSQFGSRSSKEIHNSILYRRKNHQGSKNCSLTLYKSRKRFLIKLIE